MKIEVYNIPGKVVGHHHPEINAMVDTWESMIISLEEWKANIYDIGICDYAPKHKVDTWIIDTSNGHGVFKPAIQEFRENVARPKLVENGVKFFFVVSSQSAVSKLSSRKTSKIYSGDKHMKSFYVDSIDEAKEIRATELAKGTV